MGSPSDLPGGTVTLLFSDIEGSTALARALGDEWPAVLGVHRTLLRAAVNAHGGIELGTEGDGFHAVFALARGAVAAAAEAQKALAEHPWPAGAPVRVRMGLHTGEPALTAEGYEGLDLHRCARVMAAGHGGQVLLTSAARETIGERLPDGVTVIDLGVHALRDFPRRERLFQLVVDGLPATFSALRTDDGRATNLPRPPTRLLGRDREVAHVDGLLVGDGPRLLTLTGAGGVGKTRLALQVAHALSPRFERVFLVELAAVRDPALVLPAIAAALAIREDGGSSVADALAREFDDREVLLVVDNVEQVVAAAPALGDLLARTRGLRLLVTSRTPLRLAGEHVISVAPLAADDAAELFGERARAAGHDASASEEDAEAIPAICSRLDRLPLAIELAAARSPVLPPRALLRRLDRRLDLLTVGARDADARQSTLVATLDWSHGLLDERERVLLRRLAVFAGGFTAEAAEEVCGGEAVLDGLSVLVEHSLLRREVTRDGEPRFAMLETIREYATRKLRASGEAPAVHMRHAEHMVALAERAEPDLLATHASAFDLVELEYDNLRAALDWTHAVARHDLELRLAGSLWRFWFVRVHDTEGHARLDAALLGAGAAAGAARAKAVCGRGAIRVRMGRLDEAETDGRELLRLAEHADDPALRIEALMLLGNVIQTRGDFERARTLNEEVARLARQTGDAAALARTLGSRLADVALNQNRFEDAVALSTEGLEIARAAGTLESVVIALENLASALLRLGRAEEATERFAESLRYAHEIGDAEGVVWGLEGLGAAAAVLGHPRRAARLLGAADAAQPARRQPFEARRHEQVVDQLRDELGEPAFSAAWAQGQAMRPEDASAFALAEPADTRRRA